MIPSPNLLIVKISKNGAIDSKQTVTVKIAR